MCLERIVRPNFFKSEVATKTNSSSSKLQTLHGFKSIGASPRVNVQTAGGSQHFSEWPYYCKLLFIPTLHALHFNILHTAFPSVARLNVPVCFQNKRHSSLMETNTAASPSYL